MSPLFLLLAVSAGPAEAPSLVPASQNARATVRILQASPIKFGREMRIEASVQRQATIREHDGSVRTASLVEFY
jgi:hypothetical protein